jgi:hypothetical protein
MQINVIDKNCILFERSNCSNEEAETFSLDQIWIEWWQFWNASDNVYETIVVGYVAFMDTCCGKWRIRIYD